MNIDEIVKPAYLCDLFCGENFRDLDWSRL